MNRVPMGDTATEPAAAQRLLIGSLTQGEVCTVGRHGMSVPDTLALAASGNSVFAASASAPGEVRTFEVSADGLNLRSRTSSGGVEPCHLAVDPSGSYLLTTHYGSSTLVVRPIIDGDLGEITDVVEIPGSGPILERQASSHFHQALFAPAGDLVLVCDLGADALHGFRLDPATGRLERLWSWSASSPPGSGPRHAVFHPKGILVADELSSSVSWYETSDQGQLTWVRSVPSSFGGSGDNYPSEIAMSKDGRFAYVGNRGFDTIGVVAVSLDALTLIGEVPAGGKWPQHLMIRDSQLFCAVRDSNNITIFDVNPESGDLQITTTNIASVQPSWILETTA